MTMLQQHELAFAIATYVAQSALPVTYGCLFIAVRLADRNERRR